MIKGAINRPATVSMFLLAISLFGTSRLTA